MKNRPPDNKHLTRRPTCCPLPLLHIGAHGPRDRCPLVVARSLLSADILRHRLIQGLFVAVHIAQLPGQYPLG